MLKRFVLLLSTIVERSFSQSELVAERYQVIRFLGAGAYGYSYLVVDLQTQSQKVLKALRLHKRMTRGGRKRFELEKNFLESINHPGFPTYFEGGIYKNIPFYTMEYIKGKNFEQLIFHDGIKITEIEAFKIAYELLEYIEFLHDKHIIHRDIRIPNVILQGKKIRLIDLGLAQRLGQVKAKKGIKAKNLRKELNYQADFYGLGHFLLFLLYSNFSFPTNKKDESWEDELIISNEAKHIIKRLLQIEPSYEHCGQIKADIKNNIIHQHI